VASSSLFSAQPAGGPEDPRLFLFSGTTILSVVTAGSGKDLLEVGQVVSATRTLKAEFKFPFSAPVSREDAYAHLDFAPQATSCGLCHLAEESDPSHRLARTSVALKPPRSTLLRWEQVQAMAQRCDVEKERERCVRWAAVMNLGDVYPGTFPASFADFIK
jgi:hypothetical protein